MEKPDVDVIEGICPAIAIRQKNSIRNPRSTVSTTTEIHDYLRLLFARVGRTICRGCGREVVRETAEVVSAQLGALPAGTRLLIGFDMPVVTTAALPSLEGAEGRDEQDAAHEDEGGSEEDAAQRGLPGMVDPVAEMLAALRRKGFGRLYVDGQTLSLEEVDPAVLRDRPMLQVIVDRVKVDGDLRARLTDSIETAYTEGGGAAFAIELTEPRRAPRRRTGSASASSAAAAGFSTEVPQPRLFSFNNPFGACGVCHGFGNIIELDMNLVVPDASKSIHRTRSSRGASRTIAPSSPSSSARRRPSTCASTSPGRS